MEGSVRSPSFSRRPITGRLLRRIPAATAGAAYLVLAIASVPAWTQTTTQTTASAPPEAEVNWGSPDDSPEVSSNVMPEIRADHPVSLDTSISPVESLPAGLPLRVQLNKTYPMRVGTHVEGHLIEPVYLIDHIVLPTNSKVFGTITAKQSVSRGARAAAIFNGDLTPLKEAIVTFQELETPDGGHFQIDTNATERTSKLVRMAEDSKPHRSYGQSIAAAVHWTKAQTVAVIKTPHKSDELRNWVYQEMPFHPQQVWAGTQYDAELTEPLKLVGQRVPPPVPMDDLSGLHLTGTIEARLVNAVDSRTARTGTPVEAVMTQPLYQPEQPGQSTGHGKLLLPAGTRLIGWVVRAKSAGFFGRNGSLRLTFRKVELPAGTERTVHGQLVAAEVANDGSNVRIDDEGGVKASNGASRYLAPISLGSIAASRNNAGASLANEALTPNGMDALTRIVGMALADGGLATGMGYYEAGKVVYDQWIGPGHNVVFGRDTRVEIELAER